MNIYYPNGQKSYDTTHEVLADLIPFYGADVSSHALFLFTMEFENLNYKLKWKLNSDVWEQTIVNFAEGVAQQLKNETKAKHSG